MEVVAALPHRVRTVETVWIAMPDGCRLAARLWLPEGVEAASVPAVLEMIPYRRRDWTRLRDEPLHGYVAGHGYACVRVDLRGAGDSEGILEDEYTPQEQQDAIAVIAWIAAQPWCSGAVGMMGISWGGFNALQVAAHRPPALKAIVAVGATDDRYGDDVHYQGGCLIKDNPDWAQVMLTLNALPPDPEVVGDGWRERWLARLDANRPLIVPWLVHQRRDAYWRQGSVREDYAAIACPVFVVSGWADNYANSVLPLLAGLTVPRKGLIGPWGHNYPHRGRPGPAIGFLDELVRWWDRWLKGIANGVESDPILQAWMQDGVPPAPFYLERTGRWVADWSWPSPRIEQRRLHLAPGRLQARAGQGGEASVRSPLTLGTALAELGQYGDGSPEAAGDQRADNGGSLLFQSAPLTERVETLGAAHVDLVFSVDRPVALVAGRLLDIAPDGAATQVAWGLLNLNHWQGHDRPALLVPGRRYESRLQLGNAGYAFGHGHRIALALSSAYWPMAWPSPREVTLTVVLGASSLVLPVRPADPADAVLRPFARPREAPTGPHAYLEEKPTVARRVLRDVVAGTTNLVLPRDWGAIALPEIGLTIAAHGFASFTIGEDPLSAVADTWCDATMARGDWRIAVDSRSSLRASSDTFHIEATLTAHENGHEVTARRWTAMVPRDHI